MTILLIAAKTMWQLANNTLDTIMYAVLEVATNVL
jgi:hypothetical protein